MQLLGELGNGQAVAGEIRLIVCPILLPLAAKILRVPRGVPAYGALGRIAAGEVQAAIAMHACAQSALRLRKLSGGEHGGAEAVLHIAAQDGLRRLTLQKAQQAQGLSPSAAAFGRAAAPQRPQGIGTEKADAAALSHDAASGKGRPLAVGDAAAGAAKEAKQQLLRAFDDLLLRPRRRKRQCRKQLPQLGVLRRLPQYVLRPDGAQSCPALSGIAAAGLRGHAPEIRQTQRLQRRTLLCAAGKHGMLQTQPENIRIQRPLGLLLKPVEHGLKMRKVIAAIGQPHDRVPIQLGLALPVKDCLTGLEIIASGAVPDLVIGTALQQFLPIHGYSPKSWERSALSGIRAQTVSAASCCSNGSKALLMTPRRSA